MTMPTETMPSPPGGETRSEELDRRLEVILDESVASDPGLPALPRDFASRVASARPFAPWEVRQTRAWRVPLAVGGLLVGGSLGLGMAPLWTLGPATALEVWLDLVLAGSVRPVATLVEALPLLGRGITRLAGAAPAAWAGLLLAAGVAGAASLVWRGATAVAGRGVGDAPRR